MNARYCDDRYTSIEYHTVACVRVCVCVCEGGGGVGDINEQ